MDFDLENYFDFDLENYFDLDLEIDFDFDLDFDLLFFSLLLLFLFVIKFLLSNYVMRMVFVLFIGFFNV
jgi:hypothetical protein